MMKQWKRIYILAIFLALVSGAAAGQTSPPMTAERAPSKAIRPVVVLSAQSVADVEKRLAAENKVEDLIGGEGMQLRVAIQHEKNKTDAAAELRDASDDVYYITEGSATLVLGGTLEAPREVEPGEWRSARIVGGKTYEVAKGDLIIVPRGTPHQRNTGGKDFTMILIKVFAEPRRPMPSRPGR